jgi:peptide/nickel transport system substrate-binding protein
VTTEDAVARYAAAQAWFDEKEHLVISNGPFYLERFDPPAQFAELDAFRDPSYPFKPGDLYRGEPPELAIDDISAEPVVPGEEAVVTATITGPGTVGLQYLLLDPAVSEVVVTGQAQQDGENGFVVTIPADVTSTLFPGFYELYLAAGSDSLARIAERRVDLEVVP